MTTVIISALAAFVPGIPLMIALMLAIASIKQEIALREVDQ